MRSSSSIILYVNLDRELEWPDDIEREFLEGMPLGTMCKHTLVAKSVTRITHNRVYFPNFLCRSISEAQFSLTLFSTG